MFCVHRSLCVTFFDWIIGIHVISNILSLVLTVATATNTSKRVHGSCRCEFWFAEITYYEEIHFCAYVCYPHRISP